MPTFSGCIYSLTFRDVVSKRLVGYLLKNKDNCVRYVGKFVRFVKSKGFTVTTLRTDNGLFTADIKEYCEENTIELQSCIPHEHGQIGNIERFHRSLEDSIVKLLHDKPHLSYKYWGMAYYYTLFTMNIKPIPSQNDQCAYNMWSKCKLDLNTNHLVLW